MQIVYSVCYASLPPIINKDYNSSKSKSPSLLELARHLYLLWAMNNKLGLKLNQLIPIKGIQLLPWDEYVFVCKLGRESKKTT